MRLFSLYFSFNDVAARRYATYTRGFPHARMHARTHARTHVPSRN